MPSPSSHLLAIFTRKLQRIKNKISGAFYRLSAMPDIDRAVAGFDTGHRRRRVALLGISRAAAISRFVDATSMPSSPRPGAGMGAAKRSKSGNRAEPRPCRDGHFSRRHASACRYCLAPADRVRRHTLSRPQMSRRQGQRVTRDASIHMVTGGAGDADDFILDFSPILATQQSLAQLLILYHTADAQ